MERLPQGHGTTTRVLHWLVAVLILLMIPAGLIMVREGLPRNLQDTLFVFHKNVGSLLIVIVALRLAWRMTHRPPGLPATMPAWQRRAAAASHVALYVLMVAMPLSGYVRVRAGGFPIEALDAIGFPALIPESKALAEAASSFHAIAAFILIGIIAIHVAAALQHALIRRDGVFQRMWPPVARERP
ncbi:cytochrome b [Paracoccus beibuensis]|uniref:cytochrome b n=1 Tax=Paracoccus beibuensis TaxID=547602 RepID=UPI002240DCCD|nr:cytochrome b [Paracoccus beibuensis]